MKNVVERKVFIGKGRVYMNGKEIGRCIDGEIGFVQPLPTNGPLPKHEIKLTGKLVAAKS